MAPKSLALALSAAALLASARPAVASPRGGFEVVPPAWRAPEADAAEPGPLPAAGDALFYLNRGGGQYSPGFNDSRTNRSTLVSEAVQIPAWEVSEAEWDQVVACVEELFSDYRVQVTDVDPGAAAHIEAVLGGRYADLRPGADPLGGVAGLSPFSADCDVLENSIVFVFPEDMGGDLRRICEVTAQEIAHSLGLDHEYLCEDPMSYLEGCGDKLFRDQAAPCGELDPRPCSGPGYDCQRDTQNSVALLTRVLGRRDGTGGPREPVTGGCAVAGASGPALAAALAGLWGLLAARRRRR